MGTFEAITSGRLQVPTLEEAQERSRLFAIDQAQRLNEQLIKRYDDNFDAWRATVLAGKIPNTTPPQPPWAWRARRMPDGFWYEDTTMELVREPRTDIPADFTKSSVLETGQLDVINAAPNDSRKSGDALSGRELIAMGANPKEVGSLTSLWIRAERGTPFGVARFYARIS